MARDMNVISKQLCSQHSAHSGPALVTIIKVIAAAVVAAACLSATFIWVAACGILAAGALPTTGLCAATEARYEVEGRFLLNFVVGQGEALHELLAGVN